MIIGDHTYTITCDFCESKTVVRLPFPETWAGIRRIIKSRSRGWRRVKPKWKPSADFPENADICPDCFAAKRHKEMRP